MPASMETPSSEHANLGKRAPQLHTHARVIQSGGGDDGDGDGDGVLLLFVWHSGIPFLRCVQKDPPLP